LPRRIITLLVQPLRYAALVFGRLILAGFPFPDPALNRNFNPHNSA
jgi:hypothetical protein